MKTKINLSGIKKDVFYKFIYPLFAKEFLIYGINYENFAKLVETTFILSPEQWAEVLEEWECKENLINKF